MGRSGGGSRRVPSPRRRGALLAELARHVPAGARPAPPRWSLSRAPACAAVAVADPGHMAMSVRLRVDPIICDGHGVCAELFPERLSLDDWGYPVVDTEPIGRDLLAHARRAVAACPVLALTLERV